MATKDISLGANNSRNLPPISREPHILPPVLRMCEHINEVFTRYVGPIATEVAADEFDAWRTAGQVGPNGLQRYIARLARHIPEDGARREFIIAALQCIQLPRA
jgi:hypothetical protein